MDSKKVTREKINTVAERRLAHLNVNTLPFEIIGSIDDFRRSLREYNILSDELDDTNIVHSEKISIDLDRYFQYIKEIAVFSANYLGTYSVYVTNKKTNDDGVMFVGEYNNICAAQVVFECLMKIATVARDNYYATLKRYKKKSTKDQHTDDYMYDWLDFLLKDVRRLYLYDQYERDLLLDYIKNNFTTSIEQGKTMYQAAHMIKSLLEHKEKENITLSAFNEKYFKEFPENNIDLVLEKLKLLQDKDIIFVSPQDELYAECNTDNS